MDFAGLLAWLKDGHEGERVRVFSRQAYTGTARVFLDDQVIINRDDVTPDELCADWWAGVEFWEADTDPDTEFEDAPGPDIEYELNWFCYGERMYPEEWDETRKCWVGSDETWMPDPRDIDPFETEAHHQR